MDSSAKYLLISLGEPLPEKAMLDEGAATIM